MRSIVERKWRSLRIFPPRAFGWFHPHHLLMGRIKKVRFPLKSFGSAGLEFVHAVKASLGGSPAPV